ncbi:acyl-CoA dehydrogenase family protein [Streptomyces xiaopingdaonensis]|uniref:acyl-CoA dehydrogenase family protein n=1 Tax=Streptomyces xiaopingdaonensis TaxID=1565415 RepID=UPI0002E98F11|nr:acyl-CoA dehydrogenase family protein [Streptomyces xiaopingdaonensis]
MSDDVEDEVREEMRSTVAAFLDARSGAQGRRSEMAQPHGFDRALHDRAWDELGLGALPVPESLGGLGLGFREVATVVEEFGRRLTPSPLPGTLVTAVLVAERVARGGCAAGEEVLERMARQPLVLAAAGVTPGAGECLAGAGGALSGRLGAVPFGAVADGFLVVAGTGDAASVHFVPGDAPGVERTERAALDHTRRLADIAFADVPATPLSPPDDGGALAARLRALVRVSLAAESVAAARTCLDMTVEHLTLRRQFGRPLGSFQALKHRCADLALAVHGARAAVDYAVRFAASAPHPGEVDELGDGVGSVAALAKSMAADTFMDVAAEALQLHGGVGFTYEHDLHLYLKRAKSAQLLAGSGPALRRELADRLADA